MAKADEGVSLVNEAAAWFIGPPRPPCSSTGLVPPAAVKGRERPSWVDATVGMEPSWPLRRNKTGHNDLEFFNTPVRGRELFMAGFSLNWFPHGRSE